MKKRDFDTGFWALIGLMLRRSVHHFVLCSTAASQFTQTLSLPKRKGRNPFIVR